MAKNNKSRDGNKWTAVLFGFVIIVLAIAYIIVSSVTGTWNPVGWAKKDSGGIVQPNPDDKDPGDTPGETNKPVEDYTGAVIGGVENNGIQLLSAKIPVEAYSANNVSEQAESAYTLTAMLTPHYAENQAVDWTLSWFNSESEWADGKTVTDYVTLTPTSDGALTAVCACLQDFSEPIELRVTSRENTKISAFCRVDYYQRIKSIEYKFRYDGELIDTPTADANGVYKLDYLDEEKNYSVEVVPVCSNYTLNDNFTTNKTAEYSEEFGYTGANFDNEEIIFSAGLSGGDPELTENARNWCNYLDIQIFNSTQSWNQERMMIGRDLCLGNYVSAHGIGYAPYRLTDEEKQHPRCAFYISILEANEFSQSEAKFNEVKRVYESYQPTGYFYMGDISISNFDEFIAAVSNCNTNGVGILKYTISITGRYSSYETVLSLSFKDELLTAVRDLKLPYTNLVF